MVLLAPTGWPKRPSRRKRDGELRSVCPCRRSGWGRLELNLDENVSATLTLIRGDQTLVTKQFGKVKEGDRVLTLVVPGSVEKGKATLQFELKDAAGNTMSAKRPVKIPGK